MIVIFSRFKIYTEGHAWSVSFKYIFSCDSPVLLAIPTYYEFFTRGLLPMVHYWPVRKNHLCPSIKFAVDWGNNHTDKVSAPVLLSGVIGQVALMLRN